MTSPYHVRWATPSDMPRLFAIERAAFSDPWSEADFLAALNRRDVVGMVATRADDYVPLGYVLYQIHPQMLSVINLAVDSPRRRAGVGRALMAKVRYKVISHRRDRAEAVVHESNVMVQKFLSAVGYRATGVEWANYDDGDGYAFAMRPTDDERRALGFGLLSSAP
jgi:ribosomal-protein-alanine N-acetyltransferase